MNKLILVITSFFIAIVMTIMPVPHWAIWLRPLWMPMLMICWVLLKPQWVHLGFAFCLGLLLDVFLGTLLGVHALALCFLCFIVAEYQRRIALVSVLQQILIAFVVLFFYQTILITLNGFMGQLPGTWLYWLTLLPSTLLWPLMYITMKIFIGNKGR